MAPASPSRRRVSATSVTVGVVALLALLASLATVVYVMAPRGTGNRKPGGAGNDVPATKPAAIEALLASAVVIAEPSHYAELDGLSQPFGESALERARRHQDSRDWLHKFRQELDIRYRRRDERETSTGGFIDLEKLGLARRMHDDLVEWRFMRNRRKSALGGRPNEAHESQRNPHLAMPLFCQHDHPGDWRPALEGRHVPVAGDTGQLLVSARELVRHRIGVWNPPRTSETFLSRPTVLCAAVVTKPSRIENAFMQYALWGRYCDDFAIFVPHLPADVTIGTDYDEGFTAEVTKALANKYQMPVQKVHTIEVSSIPTVADLEAELKAAKVGQSNNNNKAQSEHQHNFASADHMRAVREEQIKRSRWQFFREVVRTLDTWGRFGYFEHTFFVNEDVYALPENLYEMLSDPAVKTLTDLGTPMLLGNRMAVPAPGSKGEPLASMGSADAKFASRTDTNGRLVDASAVPEVGSTPYVNGDAFVMSHSAIRLVVSRLQTPECYAHESTAAVDVALARCLAAVGVYPRDTADARGHDRFPVMSLNWLARIAVDPEASAWLPLYRPRPMPRGFAVLSDRTVAVPLVKTLEDMATVHAWIFEPEGSRAFAAA